MCKLREQLANFFDFEFKVASFSEKSAVKRAWLKAHYESKGNLDLIVNPSGMSPG